MSGVPEIRKLSGVGEYWSMYLVMMIPLKKGLPDMSPVLLAPRATDRYFCAEVPVGNLADNQLSFHPRKIGFKNLRRCHY